MMLTLRRNGIFSLLIIGACLCSVQTAQALYVSSLVYDIPANKDFISRAVSNDTGRTNLYRLAVDKIDRPGKGGENIQTGGDKEVLFTPLKVLLNDGKKEYFKLHYRGPKDDVERYYRVTFREVPVRLFPLRNTEKNLDILPVTALSSVLIVRPRKMNFSYSIDEKANLIKNTGNTYFRVIIQRGCNGDDESSTQFYMLPGETYQDRIVSANNKKFIVGPGGYVSLGQGCSDASNKQ